VEVRFIAHQQIVHKVRPVFHQIQQNCATLYTLFPVTVGQQLGDLKFESMEVQIFV
jgi:hypothetical protein